MEEMHLQQISQQNQHTQQIINNIEEVGTRQKQFVEEKFKFLTKDIFSKKIEIVEKKYEKKEAKGA